MIVTDEDSAKSPLSPVKPRDQGASDPPAYNDVSNQTQVYRVSTPQGSGERDAMLATSSRPSRYTNDVERNGDHVKTDNGHHRTSFFSRHGGSHSHGHGHGRSPSHAAGARFCKALLIAIAVYMIFAFLVRSVIELARHGRDYRGDGGSISKDWPEFPSGEVTDCAIRSFLAQAIKDAPAGDEEQSSLAMMDFNSSQVSAASPPWSSSKLLSFSIPDAAALDTLYFLSRGSLASGSVKVFTRGDEMHVKSNTDKDGDTDAVEVSVRVFYHTQAALERVSVCALERSKGKQRGVGIFTPRNWHTRNPLDTLRFEVEVALPYQSTPHLDREPKELNRLELDYSNFMLKFGRVRFSSLDLATSNAPVIAESIIANDISAKSSNAPIIGSYNASSILKLVTSNSNIDVTVNMNSDKASRPVDLLMKTSNGPIDATLKLNAIKSPTNSAFRIQSLTSNNRNNVVVASHPVGAALVVVDSKTSNAPAAVHLPPAFEGSFTLKTSNASPDVRADEVEDPSGDGRKRQLSWERVGHILEGSVAWGSPRSKPKSWVHVESSNSPITLFLQEEAYITG